MTEGEVGMEKEREEGDGHGHGQQHTNKRTTPGIHHHIPQIHGEHNKVHGKVYCVLMVTGLISR